MASFFSDLWESIFTPGPTPTLLIATNVTFGALQIVLAALLYATYSVHFIVLSVLCGGLWGAINWFAQELQVHQEQEEEKARRALAAKPPVVSSEDSETEVEGAAASTASLGKREPPAPKVVVATSLETDVEASQGELKHRLQADEGPSQGLKSSVSTEDEWERVSENEDGKDK